MIKSTGYLFEKVAYISDCNKIPKESIKNLRVHSDIMPMEWASTEIYKNRNPNLEPSEIKFEESKYTREYPFKLLPSRYSSFFLIDSDFRFNLFFTGIKTHLFLHFYIKFNIASYVEVRGYFVLIPNSSRIWEIFLDKQ